MLSKILKNVGHVCVYAEIQNHDLPNKKNINVSTAILDVRVTSYRLDDRGLNLGKLTWPHDMSFLN